MYIAIEGVKGTGKSSLTEALEQLLRAAKIDFQTYAPTRPVPSFIQCEQVKQQTMLTDEKLALMYTHRANYHAQHTDFSLPLILGDRSILTSFVTRFPDELEKVPTYLNKIRQQQPKVPVPDLVLYLDAPVNVIQKRLANRQRNYGLHDECLERIQATQYTYNWLFENKELAGFPDIKIHTLDATQPTSMLR